jgi:hypothetical protein
VRVRPTTLTRVEAENHGTKLDSHGLSHEERVVSWKTCATIW